MSAVKDALQRVKNQTGRSHEGVRLTVLNAVKAGGFSTFKCEADPKFANMVTHLIETGELIKVPEGYPWVGLKIAEGPQPLECLCHRAKAKQEGAAP